MPPPEGITCPFKIIQPLHSPWAPKCFLDGWATWASLKTGWTYGLPEWRRIEELVPPPEGITCPFNIIQPLHTPWARKCFLDGWATWASLKTGESMGSKMFLDGWATWASSTIILPLIDSQIHRTTITTHPFNHFRTHGSQNVV